MPMCRLTLSANAGLAVDLGGTRILADALHRSRVPGFSTLTPERWNALLAHPAFADPALLFFTHRHPDHFSQVLAQQALARWPQAEAILPDGYFPWQLPLTAPRQRLVLGGVTLDFIRLPHEGTQNAHVAHYGCILDCQGFRVLLTGDCALCAPELQAALAESGPVDLAVLDFPWLTLPQGRQFVRQHIRPKTLLVCHLPFAGDDIYGYREAARKSAPKLEGVDVRLLSEPLQQETLEDA